MRYRFPIKRQQFHIKYIEFKQCNQIAQTHIIIETGYLTDLVLYYDNTKLGQWGNQFRVHFSQSRAKQSSRGLAERGQEEEEENEQH